MPRFRAPQAQAEHAVARKLALGTGRHDHRNDGRIHSLGTARGYGQALKGFADYLREHRLGDLPGATDQEARQYLAERSHQVGQKTLDLDRQAIQMHLGLRLEVVRSDRESALSTRGYTPAQVERIASAQSEANGLATRLAYHAGLRAHELLTLRPAGERSASGHRQWSADRFAGREGVRYTVVGKGGLVREVLLTRELAAAVEARRLEEPRLVVDRGVQYVQCYTIGGGHGLRHSYVQERMDELQRRGLAYEQARATVAQEVGHFAGETTEAYMR